MAVYRDGPRPRELTLWHGPFEGRGALAVGALSIALLLVFGLFHNEATVFRSLVCQRPGRCVVERGADWYGVRIDRTFDSASVVRVERGKTTGKNARAYLSLVLRDDEKIRLFEGDEVAPRETAVRGFFDRKTQPSLEIRSSPDATALCLFGSFIAFALLGAGSFGFTTLRAHTRFRVAIHEERDVLRVERMAFGRPVDPVEVRLGSVTEVIVERERGSEQNAATRVVLITNEGVVQPLTRHHFHGRAVPDMAAELREALGLKEG